MKPAKVLMWHWLRQQKRFSCEELARAADCDVSSAQSYTRWLLKHSYIELLKENTGDGAIFRIAKNCSIPPSDCKKRGRDRLWVTIRVMHRFTVVDLCATAFVGETVAHKLVAALLRVGVLKVVALNNGQKGSFKTYRLANDLGPATPILLTDGRVLDANTGNYLEV